MSYDGAKIKYETYNLGAESLIADIQKRSRNLFETRQLLCTEAVLTALNQGLKGGLTDEQTIAMAAPFAIGMGKSGCLCGALSGAVMATGLFLGRGQPYRHRREMREAANRLHSEFKTSNGSTCCRILSKNVRHDKKVHFRQCAGLTEEATGLAARFILAKRPELIALAERSAINERQSALTGVLLRMVRFFKP